MQSVINTTVGISIGTFSSIVGVYRNGRPKIVPNEYGKFVTPSFVTFLDYPDGQMTRMNEIEKNCDIYVDTDDLNMVKGDWIVNNLNGERYFGVVGDDAKHQNMIQPETTIFGVHRWFGDYNPSPDDWDVDARSFPYKVVSLQNEDDAIMIEVTAATKGEDDDNNSRVVTQTKLFTPEEIYAMILNKLISIAETYLDNQEEINHVVVTVPAYFTKYHREGILRAASISGVEVVSILHEPIAAAMAYEMEKAVPPYRGEENNQDFLILVYNLGGWSLDVTLLSLDDGVYEILATSGNDRLGAGEEFHRQLLRHFMERGIKNWTATHDNFDLFSDPHFLQTLAIEAERVKHLLSVQNHSQMEINYSTKGYHFTEAITRDQFEQLTKNLTFPTLSLPIQNILEQTGLSKSDIDEIILMGGSTNIPQVRNVIRQYFEDKIEPMRGIRPELAAAFGATLHGARLSGEVSLHRPEPCLDSNSVSKGIETAGGIMTNMIERGSFLPVKVSKIFYTNYCNDNNHCHNQSSVIIKVYEGERGFTKDNHFLGQFELSRLIPSTSQTGSSSPKSQIEIVFEIDPNGILRVSGHDVNNVNNVRNITITYEKGRLSWEEIERMWEEAEKFKNEDDRAKKMVMDKIISDGNDELGSLLSES